MSRRYFSNVAIVSYVSGALNGVDTSTAFSVAATSGGASAPPTGWPTTPFFAVLNRGLSDEEVVLVTDVTGSTVTVTRGSELDSPYGSTTQSHSANATIEHVATAADYDEANDHVNDSTAVHGVTGSVVGTGGAQTLTDKTLTAPVLTAPVIADFTSAGHDHGDADDGGTISHAVLTGLTTGDPHTQYQKESEKSAADGYASLGGDVKVPIAELPTGTGSDEVALGNHTHSPQIDFDEWATGTTLVERTLNADDTPKLLYSVIGLEAGRYMILASCRGVTLDSASATRVKWYLESDVGTLTTGAVQTHSDGTALQAGATVVGFLETSATATVSFYASRVAGVDATTSTEGTFIALALNPVAEL